MFFIKRIKSQHLSKCRFLLLFVEHPFDVPEELFEAMSLLAAILAFLIIRLTS